MKEVKRIRPRPRKLCGIRFVSIGGFLWGGALMARMSAAWGALVPECVPLPGHGHLQNDKPLYGTDSYIESVVERIWPKGVGDTRPVVLMGVSLGASVAQEIELRYPDRIAGLVLIGAFACKSQHFKDRALIDSACLLLAAGGKPLLMKALAIAAHKDKDPITKAEKYELVRLIYTTDARHIRASLLVMRRLDTRVRTCPPRCPALVLRGHDVVVSLLHTEQVALLYGTAVITVEGAKHAIVRTHQGEVRRLVWGFISSLR